MKKNSHEKTWENHMNYNHVSHVHNHKGVKSKIITIDTIGISISLKITNYNAIHCVW